MNYCIKTEKFTGPLEVLIYFFKKEEIAPEEISILQIIKSFIEFLHLKALYNFEEVSEFVVFLAILIELKSKKLLPQPLTDEKEILSEKTLNELMQMRLEEFAKFAQAAKSLREKEIKMKEIFSGVVPAEIRKIAGEKIKGANINDLIKALDEVLKRQKNVNIEIIREIVTVEEKMNQLLEKLKENKNGISFFAMFENNLNRQQIIVTFLALLELIKLGNIYIIQDILFGDIKIFRLEN